MGLNPYQHNALEVRMRHLERTLFQIRRLLFLPLDGRLTRHQSLSPEVSAQAEAVMGAMLAEIAEVAEAFDLQPEVEDVAQSILSEMTIAWADLNDTQSAKLKGYGAVDPSPGESLDPHIQQLITLSNRLVQLIRGGASTPTRLPKAQS